MLMTSHPPRAVIIVHVILGRCDAAAAAAAAEVTIWGLMFRSNGAGSEIAGEASAALAAAALMFKSLGLAKTRNVASLITHSKQLYSLATKYPGSYSSANCKSCLGIHKVHDLPGDESLNCFDAMQLHEQLHSMATQCPVSSGFATLRMVPQQL